MKSQLLDKIRNCIKKYLVSTIIHIFLLLDQCISINSFFRFAILQSAESEQYWDDCVGKWSNDFYDSLRTRYWVASEKVLLFFLSLQLHCEFLPFPAVLLAVLVFGWGIRRVCRWPVKRCAVPLHSRLSLSYKQTNNVKINFTTFTC